MSENPTTYPVVGLLVLVRTKGGYKDGELYATTNGGGLKTVLRDSMKCDHVKKIRLLIRAVTQFTHSSQAILGGVCVDTGEKLGPPLTNLVHTFIGVGGANRGAFHLCRLFEWASFCNAVDGMRCHSKFLDDINSKAGYEASERIFTIRSTDDGTVGTVDCDGRSVSGIDGQNDEIVLHNYSHQMVMFGTGEQQLKLLSA
uniref:CPSF_A domain-containing protein n=1 Tax=Globodera pallida TaxID=36090 RepID=A0A183CI57_GLOPA